MEGFTPKKPDAQQDDPYDIICIYMIYEGFSPKKNTYNHFISIKNAVLNFPLDIPTCMVIDCFANLEAHAASVRRSASMESGLYVFEEVPPNWAQLGDGWFRFLCCPSSMVGRCTWNILKPWNEHFFFSPYKMEGWNGPAYFILFSGGSQGWV